MYKKIFLNYLPSDPRKHIDYVIYYKDDSEGTREKNREKRDKFELILEKEDIKVEYLQDKENYYWLLSCSLERLMVQAERMKLELPLKVYALNFLILD